MPLTLLAIVLAVVAWLWIRNQPPGLRRPAIIKLLLITAIIGLGLLALTGRLYVVAGLLAFLYPLLRRFLPGLILGHIARGSGGPGAGGEASSGNQSRVSTELLDMTLDHDSGEMTGKILKGPMANRSLSDLGEVEFIELLQFCREQDVDSARLLESYLDRRFGDSWRTDDPGDQTDQEGGEASRNQGGELTEAEARDILGVDAGASRDDIIRAHRRMMQKMHPDRGGSTYFAARINEAKAKLLG